MAMAIRSMIVKAWRSSSRRSISAAQSAASLSNHNDAGIRAINVPFSVGPAHGALVGSAGKSVPLGMMARYTQADGRGGLISERVAKYRILLTISGARRALTAVIVAAPADTSLPQRFPAVYATRITKGFGTLAATCC